MRYVALGAPLFMLVLSACLATTAVSLASSGLYNGAKLAGKTVYYTGKGVYQVGKMTVHTGDAALDGTERMLRLTILTSGAGGSVVRTTRDIRASTLETELAAIEASGQTSEVFVNVIA